MTGWVVKTARGALDLGLTGQVWKRFARYTLPHRVALAGALFASIGAVFMQLAAPWPIKLIFDHVLMPRQGGGGAFDWLPSATADPTVALMWICGAILLIAVLEAVFSHARDVTLARVGQRVVGDLRRDLFAHLQTLPPPLMEGRRTGDLLTRLTGDIQMLRQMLVGAVVTVVQAGLTIVAMIAALFWLNPVLALIGVCTIPLTFWFGWRISRQIRRATKSHREKESIVATIAHDALGALPIIQAFNRAGIEQKRFSRQNRSTVRAGVKTTRLESKLYRVVLIASAASTCVILFVGVRSVLGGVMTAGDLLVFLSYLRSVHKPMRQLAKVAGQLAKSTSCGERVAELFALRSDVRDAPEAVALMRARGEIELDRVSFSYPGRVRALNDVSLRIPAGERVAIVGHNGAGKSTLIRLLLRLVDPEEGSVRIDGTDIRKVTLESLRRQIGWVHQDTVLFGASIAENIAFGKPEADDEAVRAVARTVGVDDFVQALPDAYDTVLGQDGCTLSGGQRQRIALARALILDPVVLLLDEPATGLDPLERRSIEDSWMAPSNRRTTAVICHRLREMDRFDRIVVLRQGRICEVGTHAALLQAEGEYARLFHGGEAAGLDQRGERSLAC